MVPFLENHASDHMHIALLSLSEAQSGRECNNCTVPS